MSTLRTLASSWTVYRLGDPNGTYAVYSAEGAKRTSHMPTWHRKNGRDARRYGHQWVKEQRSALLVVPSIVARMEHNVIINPAHPDAAKITAGLETPVWWDDRLFA